MWLHFTLAFLCFTAAVTASERSPATVRIHQERSTEDGLIASVETLGKTHHLKLKRASMTPVRMQELVVGPNGTITIVEIAENQTRSYYEDEETGAFLFMNDHNTLEGMVTDSLALHYDNNEHTTSKVSEKVGAPFCDVSGHTKFHEQLPANVQNSRQQPENKDISYIVEVAAVADSTLANYKGSGLTEYMRVYFKMVDRRFTTVAGATIAIRLTSILSCSTTACDALLMDATDPNYALLGVSITKFSQYFGQNVNSFPPFDVIHLITKRDLFEWESGSRSTSYTGSVLVIGYPCYVTSSYAYNTGVSEDDGLWEGYRTTAHEIAHNLGAWHDGSGTSTSCPWSDGYMMSYIRESYKTLWFSSCSSASMINVFSQNYAGCLKTISNPNYFTYPNYVAGNFRSLDTQCKQVTQISNAVADPTVPANNQCYRLRCRYVIGSTTWAYADGNPAQDGTPCSTGGYCKNGYCQASWM